MNLKSFLWKKRLTRENCYLCSSEKEQKIFMSKQGTIIVVDDNKGVLSAVKLLLKNHFEHIVTLPSPIRCATWRKRASSAAGYEFQQRTEYREWRSVLVTRDKENTPLPARSTFHSLCWHRPGSARHQGRSNRLHRQALGQCPADRNLAVCLPQFLQEQEESGNP